MKRTALVIVPMLLIGWLTGAVLLDQRHARLSTSLAQAAPKSAPADAVPAWFREDPAHPYAIFDAPKQLTTRQAAIYLGAEWTTLGGRLVNQQGQPLPLTALSIESLGGIRSYGANLCTDQNGYFLVYSPYSLGGCQFFAVPGYPNTQIGTRFASSLGDTKTCVRHLLYQTSDRAFYQLVADSHSKFTPVGFDRFQRKFAADLAKQENRSPPLPKMTVITLGKSATVEGKVLNADGVPDTLGVTLVYQSPTKLVSGSRNITSRPDGTFVLPRVVPGETFQITLGNYWTWQDTPTVPVESQRLILKLGEIYQGLLLRQMQPAALRGIVVDADGHPVPVGEETRNFDDVALTLILPNEPAGPSFAGPIGASEPDHPRQIIYEGTGGWLWGDPGPQFGFCGLGAGPFRLRIKSVWYQSYLSDPICLESGELRFVKIVLHRKAEAQKSP